MDCPARVFGFTTAKLHIALLCCLFDDFLSLLEGQGMVERIPIGGAHIIHADCRDGLHSRVNLGRADDKAPAATNPKNTNPFPVGEWPGAEEIHRSTESLRINIRQNRIARLALTFSPERQIQGQSDESLISQFLGIQIRTLLLHCTHGVPDNDRGIFCVLV